MYTVRYVHNIHDSIQRTGVYIVDVIVFFDEYAGGVRILSVLPRLIRVTFCGHRCATINSLNTVVWLHVVLWRYVYTHAHARKQHIFWKHRKARAGKFNSENQPGRAKTGHSNYLPIYPSCPPFLKWKKGSRIFSHIASHFQSKS